MPTGTASQTTTYVYGVRPGGTMGSNISSNDLLAHTEYPIASGPNAGQSDTTNASDWQEFAYDAQGRRIRLQDQNGTVHGYTLDVLGRLTADIISNFGSGVDQAVKRLGYSFNDAGLPFQQTSYSDAAGTTVANQVQDTYNGYGQLTAQYQDHSYPVAIGYTPLTQYVYSQPSGANYSRLTAIDYPASAGSESIEYSEALDNAISRTDLIEDSIGYGLRYRFLGLSQLAAYDFNNVTLSLRQWYGDTLGSSDGGDQYIGLDRFGRVIDQNWVSPSGTSIDRIQYGYDADGNVLYKNNLINANFSELFTYDPLNRLTSFSRGTLNSTNTAITTPNPLAGSSNSWDLNAVGDITSSGGTSRSVNSQNELTGVGSNSLSYDSNGNTLTDQAGNTYVYDAWNRIVKVNGTYTNVYDALGRQIKEGSTGLDLYYNTSGNVIEEQNAGGSVTAEYMWGSGYVNNLIYKHDFTTGAVLYAEQDANWNVTSLTDNNGNVVERFAYDPYGARTVLTASWGTTTDAYGMLYGFQGGRTDPVSGLVRFGARTYNPATDTWMERDPAGYVDGANRYEMEAGNAIRYRDPSGLSIDWLGINTDPKYSGTEVQINGAGYLAHFGGESYSGTRGVPNDTPHFVEIGKPVTIQIPCKWFAFGLFQSVGRIESRADTLVVGQQLRQKLVSSHVALSALANLYFLVMELNEQIRIHESTYAMLWQNIYAAPIFAKGEGPSQSAAVAAMLSQKGKFEYQRYRQVRQAYNRYHSWAYPFERGLIQSIEGEVNANEGR